MSGIDIFLSFLQISERNERQDNPPSDLDFDLRDG